MLKLKVNFLPEIITLAKEVYLYTVFTDCAAKSSSMKINVAHCTTMIQVMLGRAVLSFGVSVGNPL
jgi:hypothetical protein